MADHEPREASYVEDLAPNLLTVTEHDMAKRWVSQYQDRFKYHHARKRWLRFTGPRYEFDDALHTQESIRELCAEQSLRVRRPASLLTVNYINNVERLARTDPRIRTTSADWDQDPWLLGTPSGPVDLRTGQLRVPGPEYFITRSTATAPAARAECPRFLDFLLEVTLGDEGIVAFIQRWCGYSLTGLTREQIFVFLTGPGGNGKGTLVRLLEEIMGDYVGAAPMGTFIASDRERHPADMAETMGYRMVTASETNPGQYFDTQRIKAFTGQDRINTRRMRQDFDGGARAEAKLLMTGNYEPSLQAGAGQDEAMSRRLLMVPFKFKIKVRDNELDDRLRPERAGVLRWMIDGCVDWQGGGLRPPQSVTDHTAAYFDRQRHP